MLPFRLFASALALCGACLLAVPASVYSRATQAQPPAPLLLKASPLPLVPRAFYIAQVVDERADRNAVAWLLAPKLAAKPALPPAIYPVDLQGGGLPAIRQFAQASLPQNRLLRPVTIRLQDCRVVETPAANGTVEGRVSVAMAFSWQRQGQHVPLTSYRGAARYVRPAASPAAAVAEPVLRQALAEALRYLYTWVEREATANEKLATGLRVRFTDYTRHDDADTLFYSPVRPLQLSDFRAAPRVGPYAASVFPSFAYQGRTELVNGVLQLNLTTKVFVVRSSSWVSAGAHDSYTLNHEQRHFDIVKLVVERFKQRVQPPDSLTLDDYNSQLQYQYLRAWWEMNRLQKQYDDETSGGRDQAAQQRWNERLEAELRRFGVKS